MIKYRWLPIALVLALPAAAACEKTKPAVKAHEHKEGDSHEHKEGDGHDHKEGDGDDHAKKK